MTTDRTETLLIEGLARIGEAAFPERHTADQPGSQHPAPGHRPDSSGQDSTGLWGEDSHPGLGAARAPVYGDLPASRPARGTVLALAAAGLAVATVVAAVLVAGRGPTDRESLVTERPGEADVQIVPLPDGPLVSRWGHVSARIGDEMIIWGGQDNIPSNSTADTGPQRNDGAAYDLRTGAWRVIAASPLSPRGGARSTVFDGEMYVVGGRQRDAHVEKEAAAYDPSTDSWRRLPDIPVCTPATLAPIASGVLAIGQCEMDTPVETVVYDRATDRWSPVTAPPVQWVGLVVSNDGQVVVEDGATHHLFAYDAATTGWNDLGAPPVRDYMDQDAVAIADDGTVVVIASVLTPDGSSDVRRLAVRDRGGWSGPRTIDTPPPEMLPHPSSIVVDGDRLIWTGWAGVAWYDLDDGSTGHVELLDEGIGLAGTPDMFDADPVGDVVLWGGADSRREDQIDGAVITLP